jgi:hypothetical protein
MFRAVFAIESTEADAKDGRLMVTPPPSLALFPALAQALGSTNGDAVKAESNGPTELLPQHTNLTRDDLFSLAIIPPASRKTIARWYLAEPHELVDFLERLSKL